MKHNLWLPDDAPAVRNDEYGEELSHLPLSAGVVAAVTVTLTLLVIMLEFMLITGARLDAMGQLIAGLFTRASMETTAPAVLAILAIHLVMSAAFGVLFAYTMPYFPRGFWIVVGEMYGIFTGAIAWIVLVPLIQSVCQDGCANRFIILWVNVLYGTFLGIAAATYDLKWSFPAWMHRSKAPATNKAQQIA